MSRRTARLCGSEKSFTRFYNSATEPPQPQRDGGAERSRDAFSLRLSPSLSLRLSVAAVALWPTQLDSPLATGLQRFACGLAGGLVICAFACGHGSRPVDR